MVQFLAQHGASEKVPPIPPLASITIDFRLDVNSGQMVGSSLAADVEQYMMEQVLEGYASPALMMHDTKSHGCNRLISSVLRR